MTTTQVLRCAALVAALEVAFLLFGARLSRGIAAAPSAEATRGAAIPWLAAATMVLVIPFATVAALSGPTVVVQASLAASTGVVLGSITWFTVGRAFSLGAGHSSVPSPAQVAWRTLGYWALVFACVSATMGVAVRR